MSRPFSSPFRIDISSLPRSAAERHTRIGMFAWALLLFAAALASPAHAATFNVTNGSNAGSGSLRAAIDAANAQSATVGSPHIINFVGVNEVRVFTPLPVIARPMVLDGSRNLSSGTTVDILYDSSTNSASGRLIDASTWVRLQNLNLGNYSLSQAGGLGTGVYLRSGASGSELRGLQVRDFDIGVNILANNVSITEQLVQSNWTRRGVYTRNRVGIRAQNVSNLALRGATIGGASSTLDTSNEDNGAELLNVEGASIGSGDRGSSAGRVIAIENGRDGIVISGGRDIVVSGVWIGVSPSAPSISYGNGWNNPGGFAGVGTGLVVSGATRVTIGGAEPAQGNVIGHNRSEGVAILSSDDVKVYQNRIGVNPDDSIAGNRYSGVLVNGSRSPYEAIQIGNLLESGNRIQNNGQLFGGFTSHGVTITADARNVWVGNNAIAFNGAGAIGGGGATNKPRPVVYLADSSNHRVRIWFPTPSPSGFLVMWADEGGQARLWRATQIVGGGVQDYTLPLPAGTFNGDAGRNLNVSFLSLSDNRNVDGSSSLTLPVKIGPPRVLGLSPTATIGASGSITTTPSGFGCSTGSTCSRSFSEGVQITLQATPAAGSRFAGWLSPQCPPGTNPTCTFTMPAATENFTPLFTRIQHNFSVTRVGSGTVTSSPAGISCGTGSGCSANFNYGTNVTLTATPAAGWTFAGWSGTCTGAATTCTRSMTEDRSVTATFTQAPQQFQLTVARNGQGTVTSNPAGINCGATCSANFNSGTSVTLTPTPTAGWQFSSWSGACVGSGTCTVSMTQARSVTATFTQLPPSTFSLQVSKQGQGTVTSSPAGINCGATCSATFASGTSVALTPTPASGWTFTGWTGACTGAGNCTVTMSQNRSVTARFEQDSAGPVIFNSGFEGP